MTEVAPRTEKERILFICSQNSARSQMAEGLVNADYGDLFQAFSAGLKAGVIHPYAVRAMAEVGIDISSHRSKTVEEYAGQPFDTVVTVCDQAKQACPFFPGGKKYLHLSLEDPAGCQGNDQEIMGCFRRCREALHTWIRATLLPQGTRSQENQGPELRVDKFIFRFAPDVYYSDAGVWARPEGPRVRVGLSDFVQQRNGDMAFVEVKPTGTSVPMGEELATVETIKANLSVPSPVTGVIVEVNQALEDSPQLVNLDPYGRGWLAVLAPADWQADLPKLRSAEGFYELARAEAEEALRP